MSIADEQVEKNLDEAAQLGAAHRPGCTCRMCRAERVQRQRYKERENPVSRTEDLRASGTATDRTGGSGGGAPFVKWPKDKDYAWVEGEVLKIWAGKYGDTALIQLSATSEGLVAQGKDEDGNVITTHPGALDEVNVGLNSAALQDTLSRDDVGQNAHIAFEGWQESAGGQSYRLFTVLLMTERQDGAPGPRSAEGLERSPQEEVGATTGDAGPGHPDSDIPF